jgi:pyruvate/2-oxoglutarate dehydrogenase complex dihydrolipoamide acyltransferase (E2) component
MPVQVVMPQLGESVVEGTVSKWLKREGDSVREFEPLVEVSTDKVDTEIPAPSDGVLLKIYIAEGQTVGHGTLLAMIGAAGEKAPDGDGAAPVVEEEIQQAFNGGGMNGNGNGSGEHTPTHVTPVVARMAAEHRLDLSKIAGTGREGRVTKKDVEAYLETHEAAPESSTAAADDTPPWERPGSGDLFKPTVEYGDSASDTPAPSAAKAAPAEGPRQTPATASASTPKRLHPIEPIPAAAPGELVSLTPMRKAIAEHMVRSKLETSPHVTTVFEVDLSSVVAHREANKEAFAKQGVNLTLTAYFVAATVNGLRENPYLNAQWTDEGIFLHRAMHIGIAVALDAGLLVPVVKNAQDLNLMGLARAVNDLATRARAKQLKPDEVQGGTFTITNHGVSGSLFATPIINQPQVGILGVGVMEKRVKVVNDSIAIRPCCYVSLTFDHRVVDGAAGDGFLLTLKNTLEDWS